ncbi:unnamed protein product [Strongylus vulgaris]|uniref:Uncharacterized protein n=1 Tax=Strongylus vulgaris TaxID=40348 RepID=A0A3P7J1L5_STRVU|nr:unnamed protein product [Strongylus vulgaris]
MMTGPIAVAGFLLLYLVKQTTSDTPFSEYVEEQTATPLKEKSKVPVPHAVRKENKEDVHFETILQLSKESKPNGDGPILKEETMIKAEPIEHFEGTENSETTMVLQLSKESKPNSDGPILKEETMIKAEPIEHFEETESSETTMVCNICEQVDVPISQCVITKSADTFNATPAFEKHFNSLPKAEHCSSKSSWIGQFAIPAVSPLI